MRPSVEQAQQWKPRDLEARAEYARTLDDAAFDGRRILSDGREALIESWEGVAADAAGDHADREMRAAGRVAGAFEDLAEVLSGAHRAIDGALQVVLRAIEKATTNGCAVSDEGVAPMGPFADDDARAVAMEKAAGFADDINAALDTLGAIDDEQAAAIRDVVARLRDAVDGPGGVDGAEGELLAEITSDGFITHDDLQRLRAGFDAAGITPESMNRLLRGEEVHDLPPGSVEFLQSYFDEVGVAGFLEVQDALAASGAEDAHVVSAQLGDGLLALSNERLGDVSGGRGGFNALPQSVRALPTGEIVHGFPANSPYRGVGTPGYNLPRQALSDKFWGAAGKGTAPPGVELGSKLFVGASNHSIVLEGGKGTEHVFDTDFRGEGLRAENSGQAMLEISSRNHESVTRVLTGDLDGDPSTPPVQRDKILNPLFRREWGDDGAALGKNLSWMTDSLRAEPGSYEWKRAGVASFALARYISHEENFDAFMDMKGENSENIGEVNPELVRSMEQGLRGTVDYMIKAPMTDLPGWGVSDSAEPLPLETDHSTEFRFDHAKRVATLLSTDHLSDIRFGAEISRLIDARLEDPGRASTTEAGRMLGLNEHAEFMVQKEMTDDGGLSARDSYERRRDNYLTIVDDAGGLGRGPLTGLVEFGVNLGGEAAQESIIGPEVKYDPDENTAASSDEENALKALHSAVKSALSSGRLTPEMLAGYPDIANSEGNIHRLGVSVNSSQSSTIGEGLQKVLDDAGIEFGKEQEGDFVNGYSAIRPSTIKE